MLLVNDLPYLYYAIAIYHYYLYLRSLFRKTRVLSSLVSDFGTVYSLGEVLKASSYYSVLLHSRAVLRRVARKAVLTSVCRTYQGHCRVLYLFYVSLCLHVCSRGGVLIQLISTRYNESRYKTLFINYHGIASLDRLTNVFPITSNGTHVLTFLCLVVVVLKRVSVGTSLVYVLRNGGLRSLYYHYTLLSY